MKKIARWLKDLFDPEVFNGIDTSLLIHALNDPTVRAEWVAYVLGELKQMNLEVDKRLLSGNDLNLIDLCARRRAFQDVLEAVFSVKRRVTQGVRHNLPVSGVVDLDRVTA